MRSFKDMNGAVFDVPDDLAERFEDIFSHLRDQNKLDFEIGRAKALPDLKEDDSAAGMQTRGAYGNGGFGNRG